VSEYLRKPKSILTIAMLLAIAAISVVFVVPRYEAVARTMVTIDAQAAENALYRIGLSPAALATAGVDANGAAGVVADQIGRAHV